MWMRIVKNIQEENEKIGICIHGTYGGCFYFIYARKCENTIQIKGVLTDCEAMAKGKFRLTIAGYVL